MAPEVILNKDLESPYDTKADIWSLGIFMYEMAEQGPPYQNQDIYPMRAVQLIPTSDPPRLTHPEKWYSFFIFDHFLTKQGPNHLSI
jgi:serine/threonine protein kinase